jgi:hypothetical protein
MDISRLNLKNMKRLNYYQVHKNKKPRLLKKRKPSLLVLKYAIIAMQSFSQHAIIVSQNFNSIVDKSLAILENVKNHAEAINNLHKTHEHSRRTRTNRSSSN